MSNDPQKDTRLEALAKALESSEAALASIKSQNEELIKRLEALESRPVSSIGVAGEEEKPDVDRTIPTETFEIKKGEKLAFQQAGVYWQGQRISAHALLKNKALLKEVIETYPRLVKRVD